MKGGAREFAGTDRFQIERRLGAGGMGIVYAAHDRERDARVAVKVLRHLDAASLYRFKREFRALSHFAHTNVVTLYELFSSADEWFFTMELLDGTTFLDFVRIGTPPRGQDSTVGTEADATGRSTHVRPTLPAIRSELVGTALDEERLRHALAGLVTGVGALHRRGLLHRDIKPSNVIVTTGPRTVVCDFGLIQERAGGDPLGDRSILGTPSYMSPEQSIGEPLTEASDWYSVGVVLYEALTARLPFDGTLQELVHARQSCVPHDPRQLDGTVPADLAELAMALLSREPAHRPHQAEIQERLDDVRSAGRRQPPSLPPAPASPFVGRDEEIEVLRDALRTVVSEHRAVIAFVSGTSGIGKSSLVRSFLDKARSELDALVFEGRCYDCESVPHNGLDSLVDEVSSYMVGLAEDCDQLVPSDMTGLLKLFPVLRRVDALADQALREPDARDPIESRRRAAGALREILSRIARLRPVVAYIDDLQWCDVDAAALLSEILRLPDPPPLLFVATFRSEDVAASPSLASLLRPASEGGLAEDTREIELSPLSRSACQRMAAALCDEQLGAHAELNDLAQESGGNPFFLRELVQHARTRPRSETPTMAAGPVTLRGVLASRLAGLGDDERVLIEIVAVSGRPISQRVLREAADLGQREHLALHALRSQGLVRTMGAAASDEVEAYHARIREAVVGGLGPDTLKAHHLRLARALETTGSPDSLALLEHWQGAGEVARAAVYAEVAAAAASDALAFDRAANLYRLALSLFGQTLPATDPIRDHSLRRSLADALANAGRGAEAAAAYTAAAEAGGAGDVLDLRRRAAEQLLASGHFDEGLDAIAELLTAVGLRLPRSPLGAIVLFLFWRAVLTLRGLGFRPRDPSLTSGRDLARIDVCWSVTCSVAGVDVTLGSLFQQRNLLFALRAGERSRVARALAAEVMFRGTVGTRAWTRTRRLIDRTRQLAVECGDARTVALATMTAGIAYNHSGRYAQGLAHLDEAARGLHQCRGVSWELASTELFSIYALVYLGRWDEVATRVEAALRSAGDRGDLYSVATASLGVPVVGWLGRDDPASARKLTAEAIRLWSKRGFHLEHYYGVLGLALADLYEGDALAAHHRLEHVWTSMRRSFYLRVQVIRIEAHDARARAMLAVAGTSAGSQRRVLLGRVRRFVAALDRESAPWGTALARLLEAGAARVEGDDALARSLLEHAASAFDEVDLALHASVARGAIARLDGRPLDANKAVKNFPRVLALLAPPFARAP